MQSDIADSVLNSAPEKAYDTLYGNDPKSIASVGTVLVALKKRETWAVYGDGSDNNPFIQRQLFNIGCVSTKSVVPAVGGVFWLSENGVYFFDGSAPQYNSEKISNHLRSIPGLPGISPTDQTQSVGCFSDLTYWICFPTLGFSLGYFTVSGEWSGNVPYAPAYTSAMTFTPANPSSFGGRDLNEVIAVRSDKKTEIDYWFDDPSNDLGQPQVFSYTGPLSTSKKDSWEKIYRYVTLVAPIQQGTAEVTLTVDPGSNPAKTFVATFDLSKTTRQISGISDSEGNLMRGFLASLSVSVTGVAGQPAPQIWAVSAWGMPERNLVVPA
jgi:hypothetical protein